MSELVPTRGFARLPRWQIALCLLLIALVVYNPYLAAPESSASICLRHARSNRSTIGASELQHFTPADSRSILRDAAVAIFQCVDPFIARAPQAHEDAAEVVPLPIQFLPVSLWFRPPPAV